MSTTQHSASVSVNHHHRIIASHRIASHPIGGSEDRMHMHAWNGMASNQTLVGWATVRAIRSRDVTRR